MFYICETGQDVSDRSNKFGDEIYKCDWYLLPHKLQRMLIIILINAQEPVYIRGFGNVECTRESFKQVKLIRSIDRVQFEKFYVSIFYAIKI